MTAYNWVVAFPGGTPNLSGDFGDPNNWYTSDSDNPFITPAGPPGPGDTAFIDSLGGPPITVTCDGQTVANVEGGILSGTLTVTGSLSGSTISGGNFTVGDASNVVVNDGVLTATTSENSTFNGGTVNVGTVSGGITINGAAVSLTNSLPDGTNVNLEGGSLSVSAPLNLQGLSGATAIFESGGSLTGSNLSLGGQIDPVSQNEGVGLLEIGNGATATITGQSSIVDGYISVGEPILGFTGLSNGGSLTLDNLLISSIAGGLQIANGGTATINQILAVDTRNLYQGAFGGGTISVDGNNSRLTVGQTLIVGEVANGSFSLTNLARATITGDLLIGGLTTGVGDVSVSGASALTVSTMDVGFVGFGTMEVGVGLVNAASIDIAETQLSSNGSALTITAGTVQSSSDITVGDGGIGSLSGVFATISADTFLIAATASSASSTAESSANLTSSSLTVTRFITVGNGGTGKLTLSGGTTASADSVSVAQFISLNGPSELDVTGSSQAANETTLTAQTSVEVGVGSRGLLFVSNGGLVKTQDLFVAEQFLSGSAANPSEVSVDGAGSQLIATDQIEIGVSALSGKGIGGVGLLSLTHGGSAVVNGGANSLTLWSAGSISVDATSTLEIGGSGHAQAGTITVDSAGTLLGYGTINGKVVDNGTIIAQSPSSLGLGPTSLVIAGPISTTSISNALELQQNASLEVQNAVDTDVNVVFEPVGAGNSSPANETLLIDDVTDFKAAVTGFGLTDVLDLASVAYDPNGSAQFVSSTDLQIEANGVTYDLNVMAGTFQSYSLSRGVDAAGTGTDISITPCYCRGTRIRTNRGNKRVETLKIGDKAVTMSGAARPIKWIGRRSYAGRFVAGRKDILPIRIRAGALEDKVPRRDLWISPHHAMFIDGVLIEAKDLVNGVSIVQAEHVTNVDYFHIELDSHDIIIAEGALSESFVDDDSRFMFHNALEYETLYADEPRPTAVYCAPRLEEGYQVDAARRRIALRAGLLGAAAPPHVGRLRGHVDFVGEAHVAGWAQNSDNPEAPVCLDIYADGRLIGHALANRYRADLARAGLGSGRHSFSFALSAGTIVDVDTIEVRRSLDGEVLARPARAARRLNKKATG